MKILVAGARGQVGRDVVAHCERLGDDVVGLDRDQLDITDPANAVSALLSHRPDVVVNCAAYTAVDACESNVELAFAVNAHGVRNLADACRRADAALIQLSTDYVFDGRLDRPYREDDVTDPESVYGRSKLAGERAAIDVLGDRATIVRTSWVCGEHGNNMVKLVLRLADERVEPGSLAFVDDQRGCPSFASDLAPALRTLAADGPTGVVHLTNAGPVSWFEFVQEILGEAGHDPALVRPISTADLDPPRPAPRPANSVLENAVWAGAGRRPLRHHRDALRDLVAVLT